MEDLSYLHSEYARQKMVEQYHREEKELKEAKMNSLKKVLIEKVKSVPDVFFDKAYAVNLHVWEDEVTVKVQGHYDSDVVREYHERAKITDSGFVEFEVDGIKYVMT